MILGDFLPMDLNQNFSNQTESESEVAQSCPTLCNQADCSLPGSSLHGILQERVVEWVAISFSRGSSRPRERVGFCRASGSVRNLSFIWWGLVAWGGFRQRCGHLGKSCEGEGWSSREEGKAFNSKLVITFCFYLLLLLSHFSRVRLCATP